MKMITGYLEPDSGEIEVAGCRLQVAPLEARKKIGYLRK
jgi:ABC-type multidrug transport system ATPase subunit